MVLHSLEFPQTTGFHEAYRHDELESYRLPTFHECLTSSKKERIKHSWLRDLKVRKECTKLVLSELLTHLTLKKLKNSNNSKHLKPGTVSGVSCSLHEIISQCLCGGLCCFSDVCSHVFGL